jgi:hypothetical protein
MKESSFADLRLAVVAMGAHLCRAKAALIEADLCEEEFIEWVEAECPFDYRAACRYMRLYLVWQISRRT